MDRMIRNEANNLDDNVISVCFFISFPEYSGADCLSDSQVMPIRTAGAKPKVL